jgi:predicted DNA-binding transcriptional regulator YafY
VARFLQRYVACERHRLVSLGRNWYLVAYDINRHDWRSFSLERRTASRAAGARFAPRPLPVDDAATFVRARIADAAVPIHRRRRRRCARRCASNPDRPMGNPSRTKTACKVHINAESLDWAAFALAVTDAEFQLQAPPEMVEHLRGWQHRLTRAIEAWDGDVAV